MNKRDATDSVACVQCAVLTAGLTRRRAACCWPCWPVGHRSAPPASVSSHSLSACCWRVHTWSGEATHTAVGWDHPHGSPSQVRPPTWQSKSGEATNTAVGWDHPHGSPSQVRSLTQQSQSGETTHMAVPVRWDHPHSSQVRPPT